MAKVTKQTLDELWKQFHYCRPARTGAIDMWAYMRDTAAAELKKRELLESDAQIALVTALKARSEEVADGKENG